MEDCWRNACLSLCPGLSDRLKSFHRFRKAPRLQSVCYSPSSRALIACFAAFAGWASVQGRCRSVRAQVPRQWRAFAVLRPEALVQVPHCCPAQPCDPNGSPRNPRHACFSDSAERLHLFLSLKQVVGSSHGLKTHGAKLCVHQANLHGVCMQASSCSGSKPSAHLDANAGIRTRENP